MSNNPKKLRRAVVKEELVAITGDVLLAMVLNQMIYWSERIRDVDNFISEEKRRASAHGIDLVMPLCHGWIYKTAHDLVDELMGAVSKQTMSRYLQNLCDMGFLTQRKNPIYRWDNTWQYRVNLISIQKALHEHGYGLEGYGFLTGVDDNESKTQNEIWTTHGESSTNQNESIANQNESAIPKTTNKNYNQSYTTTKVEIPEKKETSNVVVENESMTMNELVKQIQDTTGVEYIHLPALESVLSMPDGIERLQKAIVNFPNLAEGIATVANPVGFLRFIAQHNIKPPLNGKRTKKCSLVKKTDFGKFEQHYYSEEELNKLFESIDSG